MTGLPELLAALTRLDTLHGRLTAALNLPGDASWDDVVAVAAGARRTAVGAQQESRGGGR